MAQHTSIKFLFFVIFQCLADLVTVNGISCGNNQVGNTAYILCLPKLDLYILMHALQGTRWCNCYFQLPITFVFFSSIGILWRRRM